MSTFERTSDSLEELPSATLVRKKFQFPVVWVVPVVAALVAGYLVYQRIRQYGASITIIFKDGFGLKQGETPIQYRGVIVGRVTAVELRRDLQAVLVTARLRRPAAGLAKGGSQFWIVRPEASAGNITGLATILTGPRIEVRPGTGPPESKFTGLESPPSTAGPEDLKIVLQTDHVGALKSGSPVYYRGLEVGTVQETHISTNANFVEVHAFIQRHYANVVHDGSKFWNASGLDVKFGIFRGAEINVESLRSLLAGGVAFATPDDPKDRPAVDGTVFPLYEEPKKEWLKWAPKIPLSPRE
jgi:paraquat-inducible protein B